MTDWHVGNPVAMRQQARFWRDRARTVREQIGLLHRRASTIQFEGPAATRLRRDLELRRRDAEAVASDLEMLATRLDADAERVGAAKAQKGRRR